VARQKGAGIWIQLLPASEDLGGLMTNDVTILQMGRAVTNSIRQGSR
jgi:hypothetical protein